MDFDSQINLEHLLFYDRECRTCHKTKNLLEDFYLIRKIEEHYHLHIHMSVKSVLLIE